MDRGNKERGKRKGDEGWWEIVSSQLLIIGRGRIRHFKHIGLGSPWFIGMCALLGWHLEIRKQNWELRTWRRGGSLIHSCWLVLYEQMFKRICKSYPYVLSGRNTLVECSREHAGHILPMVHRNMHYERGGI